MLELSTEFQEFASKGGTPFFYVEIHPEVGYVFKYVSGDKKHLGFPCSIDDVQGVAFERNIDTYATTIGKLEIKFADDGEIRYLLGTWRLKNKKVVIKLGFEGQTSVDNLAPVAVMTVVDIRPEQGAVTLICQDLDRFAEDDLFGPEIIAMHPIEVLRQIYLAIRTPGTMIDSVSLDYRQYPQISHWTTSRTRGDAYSWGGRGNPDMRPPSSQTARQTMESLLESIGGSISPIETGELRFQLYDQGSPVVAHWTENDIDLLEQQLTWDNIINQVIVRGGRLDNGDVFWLDHRYDVNATIVHAFTGEQRRFWTKVLDTDWMNARQPLEALHLYGPANPDAQVFDSSDTELSVFLPEWFGFTGSRTLNASGQHSWSSTKTQQVEDTISATRPAWLKLESLNTGAREFIKCDAFRFEGTTYEHPAAGPNNNGRLGDLYQTTIPLTDPANGQDANGNGNRFSMWSTGVYTVAANGRGQLGTTVQTWDSDADPSIWVMDVTMAVERVTRLLERFSYGAPIISVTTSLAEYALQVGDKLSLTDDVFINFGTHHNGLGSLRRGAFEILRKELLALDDSPRLGWLLGWVRDDQPVPLITTGAVPTRPTYGGAVAHSDDRAILASNVPGSPGIHEVYSNIGQKVYAR